MPPPLTMPTQWEIVNQHFVSNVISEYSDQITAISSQIQVLSQPNRGQVHEPGTHGSIFTLMNDDAIDENNEYIFVDNNHISLEYAKKLAVPFKKFLLNKNLI